MLALGTPSPVPSHLGCQWGGPGEAIGTILQMRTWDPVEGEHRRGTWPLSDGRQEGHWLICWCEGPAQDPRIWVESLPQQEGRAAVGLQAARLDSLPCFLWVPSPYGLHDQLQTTLFPKNKHAYGIGGSFVAIKGNNRVFKKITLRFK